MTDAKTQKKLIKNLKDLEKVLALAKKHQIPQIKIEDIEIVFPKFTPAEKPEIKNNSLTPQQIEEDFLFNDGIHKQ